MVADASDEATDIFDGLVIDVRPGPGGSAETLDELDAALADVSIS